MAEPTPAPGTSPTREESAWLIERHIGGVLYYWTGRPKIGEWSTDVNDARRFSRREDASCMLTWHCDDIGRAVEHLWLAALPVAAPPAVAPCNWREDEDGIWHSACGSEWASEVGATPEQHRWRFCHSCGKPLDFAALGGPNV